MLSIQLPKATGLPVTSCMRVRQNTFYLLVELCTNIKGTDEKENKAPLTAMGS